MPRHYEEKDLTPLFAKYGVVKDIIVLREKVTGQKRGCAFVSYATKAEAENAIQHLDRQIQLPGALSLLEVRLWDECVVTWRTQGVCGPFAAHPLCGLPVTVHWAAAALQVRFAKSHQYVQAGSGPEDNKQLFFTSAPQQLGEPEISTFFSQFGTAGKASDSQCQCSVQCFRLAANQA